MAVSLHPRIPWTRFLATLLMLWLLANLAGGLVDLAQDKAYTLDEFQYAHAAWLVADGEVPYRDFFEVHHPLVYQVMALVYAFGDDHPAHIATMRTLMLGFAALLLWGTWAANRRRDDNVALLGPIFALLMLPLAQRMIEIRPDAAAGALLLCLLGVLAGRPGPKRAMLAGALAVLMLWAAQKAIYYGAFIAFAWVIDVWRARGGATDGFLTLSPRRFLLGAALAATPILVYLLATGSFDDWLSWCFGWAMEHQENYKAFSWWKGMEPIVTDYWWVFALAVPGVVDAARRARDEAGGHSVLMLLALAGTLLSITVQRAPFVYSFLPFLAVLVVFSARGAAAILRAAGALDGPDGRVRPLVIACGAFFLALITMQEARRQHDLLDAKNNTYQHEVFDEIAALTAPNDTVYDNSGSFVSRPHTTFYFYTDDLIRKEQGAEMSAQVPLALEATQTVMVLRDARHHRLPGRLKRYLSSHYQPYSGDLWLWGRTFDRGGAKDIDATFLAVTEGTYFVHPEEAWRKGALIIDGTPVAGPSFELSRGDHHVRYVGPRRSVSILWRPRNGERWTPKPKAKPKFSQYL